MNLGKSVCGIAGLTLALTASLIANGQGFGRGFGAGEPFGAFRTGQPVTGAPYSATRTTTEVQKLADGTTITHTTVVKEARDANGRTFRETLPETAQGAAGAPHNRDFARVFDPVSHTAISWSSNSKQATVMHLPDASQREAQRPQPDVTAGRAAGPERFRGNGQQANVESLGSKTINGVVAEGTRTTRIIPAGKMGNDQPITITRESWVSSDLKIELLRTDTDPRFGTTTVEVTGLDRAEPAAALFQAPAGYTVQERTAGQRGPGPGFNPAP